MSGKSEFAFLLPKGLTYQGKRRVNFSSKRELVQFDRDWFRDHFEDRRRHELEKAAGKAPLETLKHLKPKGAVYNPKALSSFLLGIEIPNPLDAGKVFFYENSKDDSRGRGDRFYLGWAVASPDPRVMTSIDYDSNLTKRKGPSKDGNWNDVISSITSPWITKYWLGTEDINWGGSKVVGSGDYDDLTNNRPGPPSHSDNWSDSISACAISLVSIEALLAALSLA